MVVATFAPVLLFLSGCKTNVSSDIFLTDIYSVMTSKRPAALPLELAFEVSGSEDCQKLQAGLTPAMAKAWSSAEFVGCDKVGFTTLAKFRVGSEIVYEASNKKSDSEMPIYLGAFDEEGRVFIAYFVNRDAVQRLESDVPKEIMNRRMGDRQLAMFATLNNDGESPLSVRVSSAFVDGEPVQGAKDVELVRRMKTSVQLSDVSNAAIERGLGYSVIASVPPK